MVQNTPRHFLWIKGFKKNCETKTRFSDFREISSQLFCHFCSCQNRGPPPPLPFTDPPQLFSFFSKTKKSWKLLYTANESPWPPLSFEYSIVGVISSRFRCRARYLEKKVIFTKIGKNRKNRARTKIPNFLQKNLQTRKPEVGNGSKHPQALSMY